MIILKSAENHGLIKPLKNHSRVYSSPIHVRIGLSTVRNLKATPQSIFDYSLMNKTPKVQKLSKSNGNGLKSSRLSEIDKLLKVAHRYKYPSVSIINDFGILTCT